MSARPWTVEPHPNASFFMVVDGTVVVAVLPVEEEHIAKRIVEAHNATLSDEAIDAVRTVNTALAKLLDPAQHYVVVVEHDGSLHRKPPKGWLAFHESLHGRTLHEAEHWETPAGEIPPERQHGPLVWEHYLGDSTKLDAIRDHAKSMGDRYGKVRIARLEFLPEGA